MTIVGPANTSVQIRASSSIVRCLQVVARVDFFESREVLAKLAAGGLDQLPAFGRRVPVHLGDAQSHYARCPSEEGKRLARADASEKQPCLSVVAASKWVSPAKLYPVARRCGQIRSQRDDPQMA